MSRLGKLRQHCGMTQIIALPPRPSRISAKLRRAIELRVAEGLSITEACNRAGLSTQGWHKAMRRTAVRDLLEQEERRFAASVMANRAVYQARALEVAMDLMLNAKSEAVRARMCEFLASDAKAPQLAVHIDARSEQPSGYRYSRPPSLDAVAAPLPMDQDE